MLHYADSNSQAHKNSCPLIEIDLIPSSFNQEVCSAKETNPEFLKSS